MKAAFLNLNIQDFIKGLFMAIGTAFTTAVYDCLNRGVLPDLVTLKAAGLVAAAAGSLYILKNLFTNSNDQLLKTEASIPPQVKTLIVQKAEVEKSIAEATKTTESKT